MLRIVASLIPLLLISACNDNEKNTTNNVNTTVYNGRVLNSCGPTDGGIVRIELTQGPMDCETIASNVDHLHTDLDFTNTAAITIGMQLQAATEGPGTYAQTFNCDAETQKCVSVGQLSIEVDAQDNNRLQGTYTLKNDADVTEGRFDIIPCNNERPMCG